MAYETKFGTIDKFEKGGVEIISDDPKNYVFSNVFEVVSKSAPYEKVAVGKNFEYVLEAIRAEGTSEWRVTPHDEFVTVMDGSVTVEYIDPEQELVSPDAKGSIAVDGEPSGKAMGRVILGHGHMAILPAGKCYRMISDGPSAVLLQTIEGPDTVFKWAEICQTY